MYINRDQETVTPSLIWQQLQHHCLMTVHTVQVTVNSLECQFLVLLITQLSLNKLNPQSVFFFQEYRENTKRQQPLKPFTWCKQYITHCKYIYAKWRASNLEFGLRKCKIDTSLRGLYFYKTWIIQVWFQDHWSSIKWTKRIKLQRCSEKTAKAWLLLLSFFSAPCRFI